MNGLYLLGFSKVLVKTRKKRQSENTVCTFAQDLVTVNTINVQKIIYL